MQRMKVYKDWVLETLLQVGKRNTFVVMQSEDVIPKYRDDPPPLVFLNFIRLGRGILTQHAVSTTFNLLGTNCGSRLYLVHQRL